MLLSWEFGFKRVYLGTKPNNGYSFLLNNDANEFKEGFPPIMDSVAD